MEESSEDNTDEKATSGGLPSKDASVKHCETCEERTKKHKGKHCSKSIAMCPSHRFYVVVDNILEGVYSKEEKPTDMKSLFHDSAVLKEVLICRYFQKD